MSGGARNPALWRLLRGIGLGLLSLFGLLTGCDSGGEYQRKAGVWHFEDRPMQVADPASFQPLGRYFARDKLRGYYRQQQVPDSDGSRFQALSENVARDSQRVWWATTYRKGEEYWTVQHLRISLIEGADPASYQVLADDHGRDLRHVYHEGLPFKVRDLASFEVLGYGFTRDAQRAYFERKEIAGSDGASFELMQPNDARHARDRQHVYHVVPEVHRTERDGVTPPAVQVLRGASPASTQLLGRSYARDGARVWWAGQPLAGVDAASFAVEEDITQQHDALDARAIYRQGQRVGHRAAGAASAASGTK